MVICLRLMDAAFALQWQCHLVVTERLQPRKPIWPFSEKGANPYFTGYKKMSSISVGNKELVFKHLTKFYRVPSMCQPLSKC